MVGGERGRVAVCRTGFGDTPRRIAVEGRSAKVSERGLTMLTEEADIVA